MQSATLASSPCSDQRYLRLPAVCRRYGVCSSTIYNWIQELGLPAGRTLGQRVVVWPIEALEAWEAVRLGGGGMSK